MLKGYLHFNDYCNTFKKWLRNDNPSAVFLNKFLNQLSIFTKIYIVDNTDKTEDYYNKVR